MRKLVLFVSLVAFVIFLQSSCKINVLRGEGPKGALTPSVRPFSELDIDISTKVVINMQEGAQPSITMNGYENILKHLKTKVENNQLRIYNDLDETWSVDYSGLTVTITLPALTSLSMSGAPNADIHGFLAGKEFKVDISGASTVKIDNLNVDDFSVDISGSGNIFVNGGSVKRAGYEISGAGTLKAFPLQTLETRASISGSGSSEITATQKLTADISGASTIRYKGHPAITQDVSGVGTVRDAN